MIFLIFIFCRAYYFAVRVLKEKEFPWAWAGITTSMIGVGTIVTFLQLLEVLVLPRRIEAYDEYHSYFSLAMAIASLVYVKNNNRYLKILKAGERISKKKSKLLGYLTVVYLLSLFVTFFWTGEIIRNSNMGFKM